MKKLMTVVTAAVLMLSTSAFATDGSGASAKVKNAFQQDFSKASNVSWKEKDNFYFVDFIVNDIKFNAAYNEEGQLMATSRTMGLDRLPIAVMQALKHKYSDYEFGAAVTELNYQNQTNYFLSISNGKKILRIKATANGVLTVEDKTKI